MENEEPQNARIFIERTESFGVAVDGRKIENGADETRILF